MVFLEMKASAQQTSYITSHDRFAQVPPGNGDLYDLTLSAVDKTNCQFCTAHSIVHKPRCIRAVKTAFPAGRVRVRAEACASEKRTGRAVHLGRRGELGVPLDHLIDRVVCGVLGASLEPEMV